MPSSSQVSFRLIGSEKTEVEAPLLPRGYKVLRLGYRPVIAGFRAAAAGLIRSLDEVLDTPYYKCSIYTYKSR